MQQSYMITLLFRISYDLLYGTLEQEQIVCGQWPKSSQQFGV